MKENYLLADLPKGKQGIVAQINLEGELRHRLQDLGLVENRMRSVVSGFHCRLLA